MLLDVPGFLALSADQLSGAISILVPAIPIWDQYVDFVKWVLDGLANIFNSGGLAIIAFTIIVKTLLLPLTIKSIRSSKAMQELAPKIKEIQKKHGNDRQKASAEQMALYQQYGVNPMAGCLPMLIQMPIFFGVFFGIRDMSQSGLGAWSEGFLWLPSLGEADPIHILPILAGLFQFVQSRMMRPANQKITDPQQQIMNTMMTFMPLTVVLFGWNFLSGAVLYWAIQALYSVAQQWLITGWGSIGEWFPWLPELPEHRRLGYAAPRDPNDMVVVSGEEPKQGRFQKWMSAKMEEAQKTAAARQDAVKEQQQAAKATTSGSTSSASSNGSVKSSRRDDYQSRVDSASKAKARRSAENGETGTVVESSPAPARKKKRKKKQRA